MNTKLYVGNLGSAATARELRELFSTYGNVAEVNLSVERESRPPRGFAIVTMATPEGALSAILALNGKEVGTRVLTVTDHDLAGSRDRLTSAKAKPRAQLIRQNVSASPRRFGVF